MRHLRYHILILTIVLTAGSIAAQDKSGSFKGKLFRSDTNTSIAGARILLLNEKKKADAQDGSFATSTDTEGKFSFAAIPAGKYSVSIRVTYDREEDVPCQLLMGKLKGEKDSQLLVITEGSKKVYQVFIKVSVKERKQIEKDYDLSCVSMFG